MARTSFFHIFVYINKFTYITHKSNVHENHIQQVRMHAVLLVSAISIDECYIMLVMDSSVMAMAPGNLPVGVQTALARLPCLRQESRNREASCTMVHKIRQRLLWRFAVIRLNHQG